MSIQLSSETERLVEQEIASGRFQSVDEIIQRGIRNREDEAEAERLRKHREAVAWTLDFARNHAIPLKGVTIKELIEEGRR
jgi:putative addiction module CopG family antidote